MEEYDPDRGIVLVKCDKAYRTEFCFCVAMITYIKEQEVKLTNLQFTSNAIPFKIAKLYLGIKSGQLAYSKRIRNYSTLSMVLP